jgi:tape measure domain-containing protein
MSPQETYRIVVVVDTDAAKKKFSELAQSANQLANPSVQLKKAGVSAGGAGGGLPSALNSDRIRYIKAETNAYATEYGNQKQLRIKANKDAEYFQNLNFSGERQAQYRSIRNAEDMNMKNLNGERQFQRQSIRNAEQYRMKNLTGERQFQLQSIRNAEAMNMKNLNGERQAQLRSIAAARQASRQRSMAVVHQGQFLKGKGEDTSLTDVGSQAYFLKRALATLGVFVVSQQLIEMADAAKASQNRLRNLTSSAEELATVTARLRGISQETRTSFEGTSEIYSRMAFATQGLGYSQAQLLGVTRSLNQAVLVSGARSQEATSALIQFSQALGSNKLGGDEFRSVSEQLPYVMKIIADSLGVPIGRLKALAQEGKLTTKVLIDAFVNASDKIDAAAKNVQPTIEQAFTTFKNGVLFFVADMDSATGASAGFSKAIMDLAKHIDTLGRVFATLLLTGAVGLAFSQLSRLFVFLAGQLALLVNLMRGVTAGAIGMRVVMTAFGGPIAALLLIAASALAVFSDKIIVSKKNGTTLRDTVVAFAGVAKDSFAEAARSVGDYVKSLQTAKTEGDVLAYEMGKQSSSSGPTSGIMGRLHKGISPGLPPGTEGPLLPGQTRTGFSDLEQYVIKLAATFDLVGKAVIGVVSIVSTAFAAIATGLSALISEMLVILQKGVFQLAHIAGEKGAAVFDPMLNAINDAILATDKAADNGAANIEQLWKSLGEGFNKQGPLEKATATAIDNSHLLAMARRNAALKETDLTTHGAANPVVTPTDDKLSKWDKYIEKLQDALALLRLVGSERDKAILREEFEARRVLGLKNTDVPNATQQGQLNEARDLAAQTFDATSLLQIKEQMLKVSQENSQLLILDNSQREIAKALDDLALQAKRDLLEPEKEYATLQLRNNQYLQRRLTLYEELIKPLEDLKQREQDLGQMFKDKVLNAQQYAMAIRDVRADITALDNTVGFRLTASTEKARSRFAKLGEDFTKGGGFVADFGSAAIAVFRALGDIIGSVSIKLSGGIANGLAVMRQRANELGRTVSNILVSAFDGVTDAIVKFADTGKIGIRDLMDLIHQLSLELIRLAANQLWAQLLGAGAQTLLPGGGGGGTGGTSLPIGGGTLDTQGTRRQPALRSQSSQQAPVVVPPPVVNVYNILDPKDIPAALESPAGRRAILNVISRNPGVLGRLAGAS